MHYKKNDLDPESSDIFWDISWSGLKKCHNWIDIQQLLSINLFHCMHKNPIWMQYTHIYFLSDLEDLADTILWALTSFSALSKDVKTIFMPFFTNRKHEYLSQMMPIVIDSVSFSRLEDEYRCIVRMNIVILSNIYLESTPCKFIPCIKLYYFLRIKFYGHYAFVIECSTINGHFNQHTLCVVYTWITVVYDI